MLTCFKAPIIAIDWNPKVTRDFWLRCVFMGGGCCTVYCVFMCICAAFRATVYVYLSCFMAMLAPHVAARMHDERSLHSTQTRHKTTVGSLGFVAVRHAVCVAIS